mgnify:CR=1 FL=1
MWRLFSDKLVLLSSASIIFAIVTVFLDPRTAKNPDLISIQTFIYALMVNWSLLVSLGVLLLRVDILSKYQRLFLAIAVLPVILYVTHTNYSLVIGGFKGAHELTYALTVMFFPLVIFTGSAIVGGVVSYLWCYMDKKIF